MSEIEFKGEYKGIRLIPRGEDDNHICFQILNEDHGSWLEDTGEMTSSYWIDDLIEQLQKAKKFIKSQKPYIYNGRQYGYKFRKNPIVKS